MKSIQNYEKILQSYCEKGWKIFPAIGKQPKIMNWQSLATSDYETIKAHKWFENGENVAILTGAESGIIVVDIDIKNGLTVEDIKTEAEKIIGPLPNTFAVKSGRGGLHLYYRYPEGLALHNRTGLAGLSIDIKTDKGMIIAPPSVNKDTGGPYEVIMDLPTAELPTEWIRAIFTKASTTKCHTVIEKKKTLIYQI